MIRRNPTLIAMGDSDVQDVRNMIAKKQAEAIKSPNSTINVKGKYRPQPIGPVRRSVTVDGWTFTIRRMPNLRVAQAAILRVDVRNAAAAVFLDDDGHGES